MIRLALIRHAAHALVGHTIVGRAPGVHLSPAGVQQAQALAEHLAGGALGARLGLEARVAEELNEIDFGAWTGRTLAELDQIEAWRQFNQFRSTARIPDGESTVEVQARFLQLIERLTPAHPGDTVALVSHGDVIKAALAHYLGVHLDLFQRVEIAPASLSLVRLCPYGPKVLLVNGSGAEIAAE